ncbi:MAG: ComF family protein [Lachnospiraceae bacterium]|nr:ComF family protein [Lachnospiraceae bacterium]
MPHAEAQGQRRQTKIPVWRQTAARLGKLCVEVLYPRRCPACDAPLAIGQELCEDCSGKLVIVTPPFCFGCGKHLEDATQEFCHDCLAKIHFFDAGRGLYDYRSVAESMYRFKYHRRSEYAEFYGRKIAAHLGEVIRGWDAQALIPVPVHKERLKKRGYNQAQCLAEVIGRELSIPVESGLLVRAKKTVPMKLLDREQRIKNLKSAFITRDNSVKLKSIIVVDDIYTTGSTIDACAAVLKAAGVEKVFFITLAIGRG